MSNKLFESFHSKNGKQSTNRKRRNKNTNTNKTKNLLNEFDLNPIIKVNNVVRYVNGLFFINNSNKNRTDTAENKNEIDVRGLMAYSL